MEVGLYLALLFCIVYTSTMALPCPEEAAFCPCFFDDALGYYYYYCEGTGILELPSDFPIDTHSLWLGYNEIESLHSTIFDGIVELVQLDLKDNMIKVIPADIFKTNTNLEYLDLSNNLIEILPSEVFAWNIAMETLHLSGNKIKVLPIGIFKTNTGLKTFSLRDNLMTVIPADIFKTNTNLKYLDLINNLIEILPSEVFAWNIAMETLLLYGNEIKVLPNDIFKTNTRLKTLDLRENPIETFNEGFFNKIEIASCSISFNCICMDKSIFLLIQQELKLKNVNVNCIGSSDSLWTYQVIACQDTEMLTLYNANIDSNKTECTCLEKTTVVDPTYYTSFHDISTSFKAVEDNVFNLPDITSFKAAEDNVFSLADLTSFKVVKDNVYRFTDITTPFKTADDNAYSFPDMTSSLPIHETTDYDFSTSERESISVGILRSSKSRSYVTPYVVIGLVVGSLCGTATVTSIIVNIVTRKRQLKKIKMEAKQVGNCEEKNQTNYWIENELSLLADHVTLEDFPEDIRTMRSLNIPPISHVSQS